MLNLANGSMRIRMKRKTRPSIKIQNATMRHVLPAIPPGSSDFPNNETSPSSALPPTNYVLPPVFAIERSIRGLSPG